MVGLYDLLTTMTRGRYLSSYYYLIPPWSISLISANLRPFLLTFIAARSFLGPILAAFASWSDTFG